MRAAVILFVGAATTFAQAPDPLLWGGLRPGAHAVGYRSYFTLDATQPYGPDKGPRPILVKAWYPAASPSGVPLRYQDYLEPPRIDAYPGLSARIKAFLLDVLSDDLFKKKYSDTDSRERSFIEKLLSKPVSAHRDAPAAEGRFPLVLYHAGAAGSYEENSVLCEYLASHGYVVLTSAFLSPDGNHVSNNYGGPETSWRDLAFLLDHARSFGFADVASAGAVGHSMGAQYLIEWIGRPGAPLRALVSLDTTLEYTPENFDGHRSLRRSIARLRPPSTPVLIAASSERHPRFSTWDRYLPNRADAAIRYFRHGDYLLHGSLARVFSGEQTAEVRRNYDRLAETILAFLDLHLKRQSDAWRQVIGNGSQEFRVVEKRARKR